MGVICHLCPTYWHSQTPNVGFTKAVDIALIQFYILYFLTLAALETSIV